MESFTGARLRTWAVLAALAVCASGSTAWAASVPQSSPSVIQTLIPIASGASQKVSVQTAFTPYKLGASTTIAFAFQIKTPPHTVPQPLIGVNLAMPEGIGAGTTRLGLATCNAHTIYEHGIDGCPPNSFVGRGEATATVPIGPDLIREKAQIGMLATASKSGHLEVLYGAEGLTPVYDMIVFRGEILESKPPYGEEIATFIPPLETLPEAPYASVVLMRTTIGPKHITYYRRVHGRRVAFHPEGVELPKRCPRGGFKFAATFAFLDGASKTVRTDVRCPAR